MESLFNKIINSNKKYFKNSNTVFNVHLIKEDFNKGDQTLFVVLPNLYEAQNYYDSLNEIIDNEKVLFYPVDQFLTTIMALGSHEFQSERLYTLNRLLTNEKYIVVTTLDGLLIRQLKPKDYINGSLTIKKDNTYEIEDVTNFLVNSGYKNTYTVDLPGTFSVRGGIVDIFLRDNNNPYRLDFFDNYLESIKVFDIDTQRSFAEVDKIEISPLYELFYTSKMAEKALEKINNFINKYKLSTEESKRFKSDIEKIENRKQLSTLNIYIPFFNEEETTVLDFSNNKKIYVINEYQMHINEKQKLDDLKSYEQTMYGKTFVEIPYYVNYLNQIEKANIYIDNIGFNKTVGLDLNVTSPSKYQDNLELFYYDLEKTYANYEINLIIKNEYSKKLLLDLFEEKGFTNYQFNNDVVGSVILNDLKIAYFDEETIFNKKTSRRANYRSVLNQTTKIRHIDELEVGDYIVHYDFGIGQYMGLKTMELSGNIRDYLYIIYRDNDSLYVPTEQIDLVLKYSSKDGVKPQLSKMGSKQWQKTKQSVKKKIKDFSDRLLKLYAIREQEVGYAFPEDNELQIAFENDFKYTLTKDQITSLKKVKELMQKPKPMDLVLIGDVGFGKTEVALRAAFKAVLAGKQVLYLVPTTILARQHYLTFKERFEKYGGIVKLMSRFVSKKAQNETIERLRDGYVDVVVGTHRLLSEDIKFKDLGLLIIDEEQRFGVLHKERIKEIKLNVDTLTLSATPIPRTLQMTMVGIKDLATIETPPLNRYPVQTYVVPRSEALIKETLRRELARGGQAFYLYNKVDDIERIVLNLQKLVPEARIAYAHGKMTKAKLENTIKDFIDHEYDVLVATTIIETGIDIPNTNTLIIHDSDRLGLSQLYQIRGRVGRSDKIAYAYLMYEPNKDLNDEAYKRLKALEEFTELGSGYKIALKDLAIRGAGDILGSEQSGFIDSVGYEMYMQLLDEVINNKEELKPIEDDTGVFANRTINVNYIEKDSIRIEIHKKIAKLNTIADLEDLKDELEDRFGKLDFDLLIYMYEKLFKKQLHSIGGIKVLNAKESFEILIDKEKSREINGKHLFDVANIFKYPVKLDYVKGQISIKVSIKKADEHWLYIATKLLEKYLKNHTK